MIVFNIILLVTMIYKTPSIVYKIYIDIKLKSNYVIIHYQKNKAKTNSKVKLVIYKFKTLSKS